ncbi:hypothetical protein [Veillonella seminalis]|nr:hypothetical protein [Veillonella seminalis]
MSVPMLQANIMLLAKRYVPSAVDLASSLNIAGFSGGIMLGAILGGVVIDFVGLAYTPLAAAFMVGLSVVLTMVAIAWQKAPADTIECEALVN